MLINPNKFSFIIADDDMDDQLLIREAVRTINLNMECASAFNGSQLLDLLLRKGADKRTLCRPDAVILDLNMPVLDGLGALKKIKAHPELKELPVFILFTLPKDDYCTQCLTLGVAGLYVKPRSCEELRNILKDIYLVCGGEEVFGDSSQTMEHCRNYDNTPRVNSETCNPV